MSLLTIIDNAASELSLNVPTTVVLSTDAQVQQLFSLVKSDGTTRVLDLSVATALADVIVNSTAFQSGAQLDVTSLTFSLPA